VSGGGVVDVRDVVLDLFLCIYVWVVTPVASLEVDFWDVGVGVDAQGVFLSRFWLMSWSASL
jgi:hypothetical protein